MFILILFACGQKKIETKTQSPTTIPIPPILAPIESTHTKVPEMPMGLPTWDDLQAPADIFEPVPALALSFDLGKCYKEWFQGDSLPPTVRKYQGRILQENEPTIGRLIQCPEERKMNLLQELEREKP